MCEPVSIGIMLAGMYMQNRAQKKAANNAQATLNAFEDKNDINNAKTLAITENNAQQYGAVNREQKQDAAAIKNETSLNEYLTQLRESQQGSIDDSANGNVSDAYSTERAKRISDSLGKSAKLAKLMSRYSAGNNLRFDESLENVNATSDLMTQLGNQTALARAYTTDVNQAGIPNANEMAIGAGLQAYGQGRAASYYSKPKVSGKPNSAVYTGNKTTRTT